MLVLRNDVTSTAHNEYVTEASTIGMRPGEWFKVLPTTMGNGMPFIFDRFELAAGFAVYKQDAGCITLRVYND